MLTVTSASEAKTQSLAAALADQCRIGDCILLQGDLGMGKTAFARGFIRSLSRDCGEVLSPTFTLAQTYPADDGAMLWHFDLYRLRTPQEVVEIGLEEALQSGISLIEWPELIAHTLPPHALHVAIAAGAHPLERIFTFTGLASVWQDRLKMLKEILHD